MRNHSVQTSLSTHNVLRARAWFVPKMFFVPPIGNSLTLQFYKPMTFAFPHPQKTLLRFWGQEKPNLQICSWVNHYCSLKKDRRLKNNRLLLLVMCKKFSMLNVELLFRIFWNEFRRGVSPAAALDPKSWISYSCDSRDIARGCQNKRCVGSCHDI